MNKRQPTENESIRWMRFKTRFDAKTKPMVQGLVLLARLADRAQNFINETTGASVVLVDQNNAANINELGRRAEIIERQITGVLLQKYGVQFDDTGAINIVAASAPESDIYPRDEISLGIAPIIIVAGIAAVTLLIAGDQVEDMLEKKAKIEALKLQAKMLEADRQMMSKAPEVRQQWERWKKNAAETVAKVAEDMPGSKGWLERFLGGKSTSILVAGVVGVAALYFLLPKLRRH